MPDLPIITTKGQKKSELKKKKKNIVCVLWNYINPFCIFTIQHTNLPLKKSNAVWKCNSQTFGLASHGKVNQRCERGCVSYGHDCHFLGLVTCSPCRCPSVTETTLTARSEWYWMFIGLITWSPCCSHLWQNNAQCQNDRPSALFSES